MEQERLARIAAHNALMDKIKKEHDAAVLAEHKAAQAAAAERAAAIKKLHEESVRDAKMQTAAFNKAFKHMWDAGNSGASWM